MSLHIYPNELPDSSFSQAGNFDNALSIAFDGIVGGVLEKRLYVRNNNNGFYYTGIQVQPVILSGTDIVTGATAGFEWKLNAGDAQPLQVEWDLISAGALINLSDLGSAGTPDIATFLPFWLRIEIPANSVIQVFENASLRITATQNVV